MIRVNLLQDEELFQWFCNKLNKIFHCEKSCQGVDVCFLSLGKKFQGLVNRGYSKGRAFKMVLEAHDFTKQEARETLYKILRESKENENV